MEVAHQKFPSPPSCPHVDKQVYEKTIDLLDAILSRDIGSANYRLKLPYSCPFGTDAKVSAWKHKWPSSHSDKNDYDDSSTFPSSVSSSESAPVVRLGYSQPLVGFEIKDAQIFSIEAGSDRPDVVIILLAGYGWGTPAYFSTLVRFLQLLSEDESSMSKYRLCLLDWLGTAASSRHPWDRKKYNSPSSVCNFTSDSLYDWCNQRGYVPSPDSDNPSSLIFGGHSVGAYYIAQFAKKYPLHNFKRLLLLSPCGFAPLPDQYIDPKEFPCPSYVFQSIQGFMSRTHITPFEALSFFGKIPLKFFVKGYVDRRAGEFFQRDNKLKELMTNWLTASYGATSSTDKAYSTVFVEVRAREPITEFLPLIDIPNIDIYYGDGDWMDPVHCVETLRRFEKEYGGELKEREWSRIKNRTMFQGPRLGESVLTYTLTPHQVVSGSEISKTIRVFGIRNSGHQLMLEQGQACAEALLGFDCPTVTKYSTWEGKACLQ
eukprot:GHVH01004893.1.p1 GENE.GHVH01004893.1~~GHVH01004893.1.p1  ORF type:complete len:487 (+),score=50.97 GHVH01004893.1:48-1508(+)